MVPPTTLNTPSAADVTCAACHYLSKFPTLKPKMSPGCRTAKAKNLPLQFFQVVYFHRIVSSRSGSKRSPPSIPSAYVVVTLTSERVPE